MKINLIPDDILDGWEKLCKQSDPAPWEPIKKGKRFHKNKIAVSVRCGLFGTTDFTKWEPGDWTNQQNTPNIIFACAARTALPILIQQVRELQEKLIDGTDTD